MEAMRNFFARPVQPASTPTTTNPDTADSNSSSSTTPTPTITTAMATATITTHQPADHPRDLLSDSEISALDLGPSVMDNTTDGTNTKSTGKNDPLPEVKVTPPSESNSSTPVGSSVRDVKNESHEHVDRLGVQEGEGVTGSASENTPPSASSRNGNENGTGDGDGKKARGRGGTVGLVFRTISSPLLSPLRTSMNGSSASSSSAGVPVEGKGRGSSRPGVNRARTSFRWRKDSES